MGDLGGIGARQRVDQLVADLTASPEAGQRELEKIRDAVGAAVAAGQPLILRRDLPLQPDSGPGALPAWAVGRRGEVVGRAISGFGQAVTVEAFAAATAPFKVRRDSEASPFLVVTAPVQGGVVAGGNTALGAGSVWISASILAGPDLEFEWVGLRISAGTISGAVLGIGADAQILPAAGSLRLALELEREAPAAGEGPGGDARDADVRLPTTVTFTFAPGGVQIGDVGAVRLDAYGERVDLEYGGDEIIPRPEDSFLLVPMRHDSEGWAPTASASTLVELGGSADLLGAGWALPLTTGSPDDLGEAAGTGSIALELEGLTLGFGTSALPLAAAWLLARPGMLRIDATGIVGGGIGGQFGLYPDPGGGRGVGGRCGYRFTPEAGPSYVSDAAGSEALFAAVDVDISLDRPAAVGGQRLPLFGFEALLSLHQRQADGKTLRIYGFAAEEIAGPTVLLENALLRLGSPGEFMLDATLAEGTGKLAVARGSLTTTYPLQGLAPTLPDPYATTFTPTLRARAQVSGIGTIVARVAWDATAASPDVSLEFTQVAPTSEIVGASEAESEHAASPSSRFAAADFGGSPPLVSLQLAQAAVTDAVPGPIALLDLSGNADHLGIRFGTPRPEHSPAPAALGPRIQGLALLAPANMVSVITLPAVQWEPLTGPDPVEQSIEMYFPNSGGESEVTPRSVRLVRAAPNPALAQLLDDYEGSEREGAGASLSFPFGIRAVARLNPADSVFGPGAELDLHRPTFASEELEGARQLRAVAGHGSTPGESAFFPGVALQLLAAVDGSSSGLSPLGVLTQAFNGNFGPGPRSRVPVERFELSGYGETVFSDWRLENDDVGSISQVRFDVVNGRTSVEIVQERTLCIPFAPRFTRSIKMIRDNAGRVRRTDSGWVAQTEGRYSWPRSDVRSHPGIVRGISAIKNIRDTNLRWRLGNTELMGVRFDCLVDLEGVIAGGVEGGVPSRDQLGFVQISAEPQHGPSPAEMAQLIADHGPLGGTVDAIVKLGDAGLHYRVTRVGVGVTQGPTGPEFAMAAWGSPVLPGGGSWSVLRRRNGELAPGPVDPALGVPLVRAGTPGAPDPGAPYRIADPADLATPESPASDYALIYATNGERLLFPRPKVEAAGARAGQISSSLPPLLADPLLMATATGLFPSVADAIRFPDADYGLRPDAGDNLALDLTHNDFPVGGGDRTLHSTSGNAMFARYRDENGNPATVHVELDSGKPVPWALRLGAVEIGLATTGLGETMRILGRIEASASTPARFTGGSFHFGPALAAIEPFTGFLGSTDIGDVPLASRNGASIELSRKRKFGGFDLGVLDIEEGELSLGLKYDLSEQEVAVKFELELDGSASTPFPPTRARGHLKFEVELAAKGVMVKFTVGTAAAVKAGVGPFEAEGSVFDNYYLVTGSNQFGLGIGAELKADVNLVVVKAEIDVEAALLMIRNTCPAGSTFWLVGQLTIGVDVSIAWAIHINFEYEMQFQVNLDDGPCPEPMV